MTLSQSNINVGGDVITKSSQAYVVRGIGLINDVKEIENIVVKISMARQSLSSTWLPYTNPVFPA